MLLYGNRVPSLARNVVLFPYPLIIRFPMNAKPPRKRRSSAKHHPRKHLALPAQPDLRSQLLKYSDGSLSHANTSPVEIWLWDGTSGRSRQQ